MYERMKKSEVIFATKKTKKQIRRDANNEGTIKDTVEASEITRGRSEQNFTSEEAEMWLFSLNLPRPRHPLAESASGNVFIGLEANENNKAGSESEGMKKNFARKKLCAVFSKQSWTHVVVERWACNQSVPPDAASLCVSGKRQTGKTKKKKKENKPWCHFQRGFHMAALVQLFRNAAVLWRKKT